MKKLLSDNEVGDRLHAAKEAIGDARGQTVRGDTALDAARKALSLLSLGLLYAAETKSDVVETVIGQTAPEPRRNSGER